MYRILITGAIHPIGVEKLTQETDLEVDFRPDLPMNQILEIIDQYHCLITRSETPIQKELIDRATNLKVIVRAAVGVANIDIQYATEKGILVTNTPGKNTNSAAELTLGIILALIRKIPNAHQTIKDGGWNRHAFNGIELQDKTIGIIGLGNVGHRVAKFAHGFDMKVLAYDPYLSSEAFERHRVKQVDLDTLVRESDFISVHTPKTQETIGILSAENIAKMKKGVILVNAARGGIIDEDALYAGLTSGHIAGAAIDTWNVEPVKDSPLRNLPNIIMTPHIGATTIEAQVRIAETVAIQTPRALRGEIVDYPVNMPQISMIEGKPMTAYTVLAERLGSFACQFIDFAPSQLKIIYRGSLAKHDCSLLRLAFLKGFLKHTHDFVSYVNAEQCAENNGLQITEEQDAGFVDYESALKFELNCKDNSFKIGGVVFSGPHPRLTYINDYLFETDTNGTVLVTKNIDCPGMVGVIGTALGKHGVNIDAFNLARNIKGGEAMALIKVDNDITEESLENLRRRENITFVKKIVF